MFGGSYGEGVLFRDSKAAGYYNSVGGSWGLQVGAQSYGYALFLMTDKAVDYLRQTKGWEIGVGPTVVVVDEGVARNLSTSTLKDDAYAFIFDQQGLMGMLSDLGSGQPTRAVPVMNTDTKTPRGAVVMVPVEALDPTGREPAANITPAGDHEAEGSCAGA